MNHQSVLTIRQSSLAVPLLLGMALHMCAGLAVFVAANLGNPSPPDDQPVMVIMREKVRGDRPMVQRSVVISSDPATKNNEAKLHQPARRNDWSTKRPLEQPVAPDAATMRAKRIRELNIRTTQREAVLGAQESTLADPRATDTEPARWNALGESDPVVAAYEDRVQALFREAFRPMPHLRNLHCVLLISAHPTSGRIVESKLSVRSNNESYDAACTRAVALVGKIPVPPTRIAERYARGFRIRLKPRN